MQGNTGAQGLTNGNYMMVHPLTLKAKADQMLTEFTDERCWDSGYAATGTGPRTHRPQPRRNMSRNKSTSLKFSSERRVIEPELCG